MSLSQLKQEMNDLGILDQEKDIDTLNLYYSNEHILSQDKHLTNRSDDNNSQAP